MDNPFLNRGKKPHRHGHKAEKKTANRLGGRLTPGSGALDGAKGDIVLPDVLLENKCTVNASVSLKLDWLCKVAQEAREQHKIPALSLQFVLPSGEPLRDGKWVMIPESVFNEIKEMCKDV